jgi:hypothetical protein
MRQIHQLIMSNKMNSKTHKIISATYYPVERHFVVPIDWEIEDIHIRYDHVFHKEEFKEVPVYEMEGDEKYPEKIEEGDWEDLSGFFSCCESDEEDEEEEVNCLCPNCDAEGTIVVSKKRAKELKENQELELVCPFGDECEAKQEEEQEKGCVKCGVRPRHNQTDEDGSYLCERYCDNDDCPYLGYCYGEVKDEYEGKPYICVGCTTGKGIQEQEEQEEQERKLMEKEDK